MSPSDRSIYTDTIHIYYTPDESLLTAQPANFIITGILKVTLCVSLWYSTSPVVMTTINISYA